MATLRPKVPSVIALSIVLAIVLGVVACNEKAMPTATIVPTAPQPAPTTAATAAAAPTKPTPATAATAVPVEVEEIRFQSDGFNLVGDLQIPNAEGKHPVIIMVHGDGPVSRYDSGKYRPIMDRFLRAGYAVFSWDKPGTGKSTGKLLANDSTKLSQRTAILVKAIELIKEHPAIDPEQIGLWGISQAGYVMPLALKLTDDIAFMIVTSGPAMDSYDQGAFLVGQRAFCAGASQEEAKLIEQYVSASSKATTYQEYYKYSILLRDHPAIHAMGISWTPRPESEWEPEDRDKIAFFNPIEVIERTTIPVLAFFGERDRQVDPFQGAQAYKGALQRAGNQNYRVELIPGVDHNIVLCETGCLTERDGRSRAGWLKYAPEYLDVMEEWVVQLRG